MVYHVPTNAEGRIEWSEALTNCLPRACLSKAASITCLAAGGEIVSSSVAPWFAKSIWKQ